MSSLVNQLLATAQHPTALTRGCTAVGTKEYRSWNQIHQRSLSLAKSLSDRGIGPGTAVCVLSWDPLDTAEIAQACWLLGASITMLPQHHGRQEPGQRADDVARIAAIVGSRHVITHPSEADDLTAALPDSIAVIASTEELREPSPLQDLPELSDRAVALRQLTSGSTAEPKAVVITHGGLMANLTAITARSNCDPNSDIFVSWLPLFHDMGMVGFLAIPMILGASLFKSTPARFLRDPLSWIRDLSEYRGTVTSAPNFAYGLVTRFLMRRPEQFDLRAVRVAMSGGEPIDPETIRAFLDIAAGHGLDERAFTAAAGMAEVGVAASFEVGQGLRVEWADREALKGGVVQPAAVGDPSPTALTALGRPLPGVETRIWADGGPVGELTVGEIHFRGPCVSEHYDTLAGPVDLRDKEGWLPTGDLGFLSGGELVICGRRKDIIIIRGRNILPTDVERAACRVAGVRHGGAVAVRVNAGLAAESFGVLVESPRWRSPEEREQIKAEVTKAVVDAVQVRPVDIGIVRPGGIPRTTSGKLRRAGAVQAFLDAVDVDRPAVKTG